MKHLSLSRLAAGVLACTLGVSLTACGADTRWIASVGGEEIPAGIYVISQMQAVTEAQSSEDFDSTLTDIHENVIDDKDFDTWVLDRAKEMVTEYAAIETMFDEEGLTLSDEDLESIDYYVESMWSYYEEPYTGYGISEDSYTKYVTDQYKYTALFNARYGEGGSDEVSSDEVTDYLLEHYAVVQVLPFSTIDSETGEAMDDTAKNDVYQTAKDYLKRAEDGEAMEDLRLELEKESASDPDSVEMDENDYLVTVKNGQSATDISSDLSSAIFESAEEGTPVLLNDDSGYYVVLRYPATKIEDNYDTYKTDCLMGLKEDEFDEIVDEYAGTMDITFHDSAIKGLKLSKILE